VGKIWAVLRKGLGWLAGLINTAKSHNKGYSAYKHMLIFRFLIACMRCDQCSWGPKRTWPGRSNWGGRPFFNKQGRPKDVSFDAILQRYLQGVYSLEGIYCSRDGSEPSLDSSDGEMPVCLREGGRSHVGSFPLLICLTFCSGYFGDRVSQTVCSVWPWTMILLISASQVARITGMSHWC
jgi:hypothetical protein